MLFSDTVLASWRGGGSITLRGKSAYSLSTLVDPGGSPVSAGQQWQSRLSLASLDSTLMTRERKSYFCQMGIKVQNSFMVSSQRQLRSLLTLGTFDTNTDVVLERTRQISYRCLTNQLRTRPQFLPLETKQDVFYQRHVQRATIANTLTMGARTACTNPGPPPPLP